MTVDYDEGFAEHRRNNPTMYTELVRLARQAKASGYDRTGIKLLTSVLRWDSMFAGTDDPIYKINDKWASRYARLIMEQEPDLAGFFDTRKLRT